MKWNEVSSYLKQNRKKWLVTGGVGFIGSHLVEALLRQGQEVVALDNLSTGFMENINDVLSSVGKEGESRFKFIKGSISDSAACKEALSGVDIILHQAALGSVPRSIEDPISTDESNVLGFVTLVACARDAGVKKFVYASSSSVYGDIEDERKQEDRLSTPLSPYAVSKLTNELYAAVFGSLYSMSFIGLRYFNVFGPRQNPNGAYAAVIPRWLGELIEGKECSIYGDGTTSRDFCYVQNVVQANIRAGLLENEGHRVFNIAVGETTSLNQLYEIISGELEKRLNGFKAKRVSYEPFRKGDIKSSLADISRAKRELNYEPSHNVREGLSETVTWYVRRFDKR